MIVYPVFVAVDYEPGSFLGVASSKEEADIWKLQYKVSHPNSDNRVYFQEYEVGIYDEIYL